jgi:hypothetical protein
MSWRNSRPARRPSDARRSRRGGVHIGRVFSLSLSLSLPILLFSSFLPLSQSVVTVIMQLTLISLLLINKFRLLELEIEFTRQRLGIGTRVEAAQVFFLLRPHH